MSWIFFFFSINLFRILDSKNAINYSKELFNNSLKNKFYNSQNNLRNLDSNNSDKKNLILGFIRGYTWTILKPFFISLISANIKNYDLVIFVDRLSDETKNRIKLCGAIIKEIPEKNLSFQGLIKYKWKLYYDFIKENKDKYNLVFLSDIRDVIIQKDIFEFYKDYNKPFISFNLEDNTLRTPPSKYWIKIFLTNKEEYNKISNENVISEGTIISKVDKFIEFADTLLQLFSNYTYINDQGAINYLIYYKKFMNDSIIMTNNSGPILTISFAQGNKVMLDSENNFLNYEGKVAAIVHKYDKKPNFIMKLNNKYSDDILNKYFGINNIDGAKKVNYEYQAKINRRKRIKIIRKIILFSFITLSTMCIIYTKAKRARFFEESEIIIKNKKKIKGKGKKSKKKHRRKNYEQYDLTTSEREINKFAQ